MGFFDRITGRQEQLKADKPSSKQTEKRLIRVTEWSNERSKKDINSWRAALSEADSIIMPRRWGLIKLYDELELDTHIIMLINRYRRHLTGRNFVLKDSTGKTDLEATKLIQKRWFLDLLKQMSNSKFYGHSLMQIKAMQGGEIKSVELIKRKFIVPELGGYIQQQGAADVINYRNDPELSKWIFEADNGDYGYLNPAAPHIMFKKNALIAWSEFCEVFGLPIRYVETDNTNASDIARLKSALINMGKSAYGIFQSGESLKFAEVNRSDAYNVFDRLKDAANMEMSKMILGETMTSDVGANGGNRALGEVHQQTSNETGEENRQDAVIWVNEVVLPCLNQYHGYGFEKLEFDYPAQNTFSDKEWKVLSGLLSEFDIDASYFMDKYGVPITGVKKKNNAPVEPDDDDAGKGKNTPQSSAEEGDPSKDPELTAKKLKQLLDEAKPSDYQNMMRLHGALLGLYYEHSHDDDDKHQH